MQYRPEIDGLRAVAVVPVVLFHAGFSSFSGGFVGVDIFLMLTPAGIPIQFDYGHYTLDGAREIVSIMANRPTNPLKLSAATQN